MSCYDRELRDTSETEKLWSQAEATRFHFAEKLISASEADDF